MLRKIRGKFWMVQSERINPQELNSVFGDPTVNWPGRSIFTSKAKAEDVATRLAKKVTNCGFFVMEARTMIIGDVSIRKERLK